MLPLGITLYYVLLSSFLQEYNENPFENLVVSSQFTSQSVDKLPNQFAKMSFVPAARDLSIRELAIQASASANLSTFSAALDPIPGHAEKVEATFAKSCPTFQKFATLCDTNVVKQLTFIQPNFKMVTLSCPFPAIGRANEEVFAGSLGDSMDLLCPVTIRMKDVRGDVISICESRNDVDKFNLPTSTANPLEEDGPAPPEGQPVVPPGPDRIMIDLTVATKEPCFVAIPKVFPITSGVVMAIDPTKSIVTTPNLPAYPPDSLQAVWYEAMRYGIRHLDNYSIHASDTLFQYEGIEKASFFTKIAPWHPVSLPLSHF